MIDKIVPVIIESTGEVVGTAKISPSDENGRLNARISITNPELLRLHKGLIKILLDKKEK